MVEDGAVLVFGELELLVLHVGLDLGDVELLAGLVAGDGLGAAGHLDAGLEVSELEVVHGRREELDVDPRPRTSERRHAWRT